MGAFRSKSVAMNNPAPRTATRPRPSAPAKPLQGSATTVAAYSISAEDIAAEHQRVGGDRDAFRIANVLQLDRLELRPLGPGDLRLKILAVSAEHNILHAATADTVNIAEIRGGKIYPGNSAVGEVVEVGDAVSRFRPGDVVLTQCNARPDPFGFPLRIHAYDDPQSIGWYAEQAVVAEWQVVAAPLACGLSLWEIAALPLRAPTAYHLWRRGEAIYRAKVSYERKPVLNVLSFGGGVGELFLMLARFHGHNAYFCSGSAERRAAMEQLGIVGIDQREFHRFAQHSDVRAFGEHVAKITDGAKMDVVCDMLRGPVFDAGIAAAARQGVNVSSGWQLAKATTYDSAALSVKQITLDHMHYETLLGVDACTALYGKVFRPAIHKEVYAFQDMPRAFEEMDAGLHTGIPVVRIAEKLPASVRDIA